MKSSLDQLSVIPPRSRAEHLAEQLLQHIRTSGLGPGDQLGTLDEIRDEVGYARTTVSEAVRLLRERGIIEIRPGRGGGLFVAEETPVVRMRHTLLSADGSVRTVADAVELREALEAPIALSAASHCSPAEAAELRRAAAEMTSCGPDFDEFIRRNWALHGMIADLSPNTMMSAVYTSCLGYLTRSGGSYDEAGAVEEYIASRAAVHVALVEAIIADDPERIRAAIRAHNHTIDEEVES